MDVRPTLSPKFHTALMHLTEAVEAMLSSLRDAVSLRVDAGESLEVIEREVVDPAPLDEERRAALWLFAWATVAGGASAGRPKLHRPAA